MIGLVAAPVWGPLGAPHFDGTARSLLIVDLVVLLAAASLVAGTLLLARAWSLPRFAGHIALSALGFAAFFAVMFSLILSGGKCGRQAHEASWRDADLYIALEAPTRPAEGMEINRSGYALAWVRAGQVSYSDGALHARLQEDGNGSALAREAHRLLEVATRMDEATIEQQVKEFLQNGTQTQNPRGGPASTSYRLELPIDVEGLMAWIGADDVLAPRIHRDGVIAEFDAASKHVTFGEHELDVDGWGHATMSHYWGEISDAAVLADVRYVLDGRDLPSPDTVHVSGSVC